MRDFVEDDGRIVGWERYDFLSEFSIVIIGLPVVIMISLLLLKGKIDFGDITETLQSVRQMDQAVISLMILLLFSRLLLLKGNRIVFDKGKNELKSTYEFRFGLRWVERWRIDEIVSVEAIRSSEECRVPNRVVVRFKRSRPYSLGDSTDPGRVLQTARLLTNYLGL